jgi:hypothetical protein
MKILKRISKIFGIEYCYACSRCIWWQKGRLLYVESPKDLGFKAPACQSCILEAQEHQGEW